MDKNKCPKMKFRKTFGEKKIMKKCKNCETIKKISVSTEKKYLKICYGIFFKFIL
jgi:hypothetical protein